MHHLHLSSVRTLFISRWWLTTSLAADSVGVPRVFFTQSIKSVGVAYHHHHLIDIIFLQHPAAACVVCVKTCFVLIDLNNSGELLVVVVIIDLADKRANHSRQLLILAIDSNGAFNLATTIGVIITNSISEISICSVFN